MTYFLNMILVLEHMCYRWWENSIHLDIQSCFFEIHPQNHCNIIGTTWDETELSSSQFTLAGCFRKGGGNTTQLYGDCVRSHDPY